MGFGYTGAVRDISSYRRKTVAADRWYSLHDTTVGTTTTTLPAGELHVIPFITPEQVVVNAIGIRTAINPGASGRLGIYTDNGNLYPGSLVIDAGVINLGLAGAKTIAISQTLLANSIYWLAIDININTTLSAFGIGYILTILGWGNTLDSNAANGWYVAQPYGALPVTYPGGGTLRVLSPAPAIFVRLD